jgi:6-phosphogluconate dehydrogenase
LNKPYNPEVCPRGTDNSTSMHHLTTISLATYADLTATALASDEDLSSYSGYVEDSGEGRWTIQAAIEEAVPAEVLSAALYTRFRSRQDHTFAEKILSAMRKQFGGHREPPKA